jgi:membrane-associated protein
MRIIFFLGLVLFCASGFSQAPDSIVIRNQYHNRLKETSIIVNGKEFISDNRGAISLANIQTDSIKIEVAGYKQTTVAIKDIKAGQRVEVVKQFVWKDLFNPEFYIVHGGLWLVLFIVFAETGLFVGFFLPGDALLFVVGILSDKIVRGALFITNSSVIDLFILWVLISIAGILGNFVGYWFGKKSGPFLYHRKDTFFFKKKYLLQAHDFYEKNGGGAIIVARFVPFIRTFAPIVAGIVEMDKKKFVFFNVLGCMAWVASMLIAGHFLQTFIYREFHFDLKEHLEVIVIGIVLITTLPVIWKVFLSKSKTPPQKVDE